MVRIVTAQWIVSRLRLSHGLASGVHIGIVEWVDGLLRLRSSPTTAATTADSLGTAEPETDASKKGSKNTDSHDDSKHNSHDGDDFARFVVHTCIPGFEGLGC